MSVCHGWRTAAHTLNHKQEAQKELESAYGFENSKANPSDVPPLARPHLLHLLKQPHQLGLKYSNICACEGHLI